MKASESDGANEEELARAATKIGAAFRGKKAREAVENTRREIRQQQEELENAATRIGAAYRGKKAREMVAHKKSEVRLAREQQALQDRRSSLASQKEMSRLEAESSRTSRKEGENISPEPNFTDTHFQVEEANIEQNSMHESQHSRELL